MELEPAHVAGANQLNEGMRACWDSHIQAEWAGYTGERTKR